MRTKLLDMDILTKITIVILTALLAAAALALIKAGAQIIFNYAENRWSGSGAIGIIIAWIVALPIMVLLSLFCGLYRFIRVNNFHFLNR